MDGSSYYIPHRSISGSNPSSHSGLHGDHSGVRAFPTSPGIPFQSTQAGAGSLGSAFWADSSLPMAQHGMSASGIAGMGQAEPVKRKRGRPRKYGPEGNMSSGFSPLSTPPTSGPRSVSGAVSMSVSGSAGSLEKPRRGRPPGTGRKQLLGSLGEWFACSAGTGFTPHSITIPSGEDVAAKIMSISNQGQRAVCILSANGSVTRVALCQSAASGEVVTYQGLFEILCLSGSYLLTEERGLHGRSGGITVSLSGPDGRVIGGTLGGVLIAAGNVQVIVGSFVYRGSKAKNKDKTSKELGVGSESLLEGDQDGSISPNPHQSLSLPSLSGGVWSGSRSLDMRSSNIDINLTRG